MKDLQLIHELCESRVFRTKQSIATYKDSDKRELYYAILLSTIALSQDTHTNSWAEKYASQAASFGNFDYFRTSGTDLYVLTFILQQDLKIISKSQAQVLVRVYRSLGKGRFDRSLIEQTLLRMERSLSIGDAQLRNARRIVVNWTKASGTERKQAVTRLHRFIRTKAKLAEVLPYLLVLTKGDKGHFGKMSPLKKAAALAGAGLAGLVIGYKTHDQNRRWNIRNSVNIADTPLTEDRATQLFQIVKNMSQHPEIEKVINVKYLSDGISAFIRTTDGNAYEFEIRPARYAKTHQAHLREGWEWSSINEDENELQFTVSEEPNEQGYYEVMHPFGYSVNNWTTYENAVRDAENATDVEFAGYNWLLQNGHHEEAAAGLAKMKKKAGLREEESEPECQDCYDTGYTMEMQWEDQVTVPCSCKNALEFRNKDRHEKLEDRIHEDDKQEFVDNLKGKKLCPTCEAPMDSVQLSPGGKRSYICTNCL